MLPFVKRGIVMQDKPKAIILMLISALSFALMASMVKLSGNIPLFEKVFFRNLVSLLITFVALKKNGYKIFGKKENRKYLFARSLLGLAGVSLYFYAVNNMYLADASMLNRISPFVVTLFAWFFLKEKITKVQIPALIIIFSAAMLIIKPKFDASILPALAGFLSAICAGGAYTLIRFLRNREHPSTIVFHFSFVSVAIMLPLMLMDFMWPDPVQLISLLATGVFAAGGQILMTHAYRFANAGEVSIYSYANIIFNAMLGFLFWGEISDFLTIIGGLAIIAASVVVYVYNRKFDDNRTVSIKA